jgi:phage shock protein PspC (stress-responsive transcriptional regulator)
MQKVTSVNLNGNVYQLEEDAYSALQSYLNQAREKLNDNPDQDEIMQDFEQAIAEKCEQLVHKHKNVVTNVEMTKIIASMGPVQEAPEEEHEHTEAHHAPQAPKRLYTLKEGEVIGGVCNGLAAYFNVDVTIMRLLFIILAFATGGFWVLVYFIALVVIPEAKTPEQKAELRGERFTAADVLDRAKKKYAEVSDQVSNTEHWKKVRDDAAPALSSAGEAVLKIMRVLAALAIAAIVLFMIAMTAAWTVALWTVVSGGVQMQDQLSTISHWAAISGIIATYALYALPAVIIVLGLKRFMTTRNGRSNMTRTLAITASLWTIALISVVCIIAVNAGRINDYQRTHGYLYLNSHKTQRICINSDICTFGKDNRAPLEERY